MIKEIDKAPTTSASVKSDSRANEMAACNIERLLLMPERRLGIKGSHRGGEAGISA
jgi:hypothetical protein